MEFANHMRNLRHEIEQMRAVRGEIMSQLHNFAHGLHRDVAHQIGEMHSSFAQESARARGARGAFASHNRRAVGEMLAMLGGERSAAHHNFFGTDA